VAWAGGARQEKCESSVGFRQKGNAVLRSGSLSSIGWWAGGGMGEGPERVGSGGSSAIP